MWKPDVCIYHFPCPDGFTAAWAVWKKWGDDVEFIPRNHGMKVPSDAYGKRVLIVDFSYKKREMDMLVHNAYEVVVLDHHKSAKEELKTYRSFKIGDDLSKVFNGKHKIACCFDMDRSGAMMSWNFCFPEKEAPELVKFVQDRDLWNNKIPKTEEFNLALTSYDYDFITWDTLAENPDMLLEDGVILKRYRDILIKSYLDSSVVRAFGGYDNVAIANVPHEFSSELGNAMLKYYPHADFSVCWYQNRGGISYSLRSEKGRVDVSQVAQRYGGGGHRNASGFRVPT